MTYRVLAVVGSSAGVLLVVTTEHFLDLVHDNACMGVIRGVGIKL
jgi:hypothetical protein